MVYTAASDKERITCHPMLLKEIHGKPIESRWPKDVARAHDERR